MKYSNRLRHN